MNNKNLHFAVGFGHIFQSIALDMVNLSSGAEITTMLVKIVSGLLLTNFVSFDFPPLEVEDYVSFSWDFLQDCFHSFKSRCTGKDKGDSLGVT